MDAVENMYRIAGDPQYSDTHRDLAARAIVRASRPGSIRQQIARDVAIEMARETLAEFDAEATFTVGSFTYDRAQDISMWHAAMAGRLRSVLGHLLEDAVPGLAEHTAAAPTTDEMISALDSAPDLSDGIDPRTWREVYDAGLVTAADVTRAYGFLEHTAAAQDKIIEASR